MALPKARGDIVSLNQSEIINSLITIGPMTAYELRLQLSQDVQEVIASLKSAKQIYVYDWEDGAPVYAAGYAKDAKRPPPKMQIDRTFNARLVAKSAPNLGIWSGLAR